MAERKTQITKSLLPEIQEIRDSFVWAKEEVRELLQDVGDELFNKRPAPDSWSVAECLDHLCEVGGKMIPYLVEGAEKTREKKLFSFGPFKPGIISRWIIKNLGPADAQPGRRLKAPGMYRPSNKQTVEEALQAFEGLQDRYIEQVMKSNMLDLGKIRVRSAVTPFIRLNLWVWYVAMSRHQMRHIQQAQRALAQLKS